MAHLFAQTASQEPGQAEARDRDRAVENIEWTQPPREARGIWFASRDMLETREQILAKLDAIQQAGYNIVLLDSWFRGYAGFEGSDVAPRYPGFKDDVFGFIIEESLKRGLEVHSWPEYGFYAYHTQDPENDPSAGPILDRHPELMALSSAGEKYLFNPQFGGFYSMCPSNPKSHELLGQGIVDSVTLYPALTGGNLDRFRYP
ncbi:MAG TPA: family 10 glycosylhydrolase, partial [Tepidisphaeraceae bacterium]|nr:family 10 glycosylhydrolase [Tepidisphaeraceae bacterium]